MQLSPKEQADCVADGVRQAFADALSPATPEDIMEAITEGVRKAFDQLWASQIEQAIYDGVKAAMKQD